MATNRTVAFAEEQARFLAACQDLATNEENSSLRSIAKKHNVPRTTLQPHAVGPATPSGVLERSIRRAICQRLTENEETIIAETVAEYQNRGTPLVRSLALDIVSTFVWTLSLLGGTQKW